MEEIISEETALARESARAQYVAARAAAYAAIGDAREAKAAYIARLEAAWATERAAEGPAEPGPIHRLSPDIARTDRRVVAGMPYVRATHRAEEAVLLARRGCDELADMLALAPGHDAYASGARDAAVSWRYVRDVAASGYPRAYGSHCRPWEAIVEAATSAASAADAYAAAYGG